MNTVKVNVSELSSAALDWCVAKCEHEPYSTLTTYDGIDNEYPASAYSTDWAQAGPIIEREGITCGPYFEKGVRLYDAWQAYAGWDHENLCSLHEQDGKTCLIASMRCYVASKLGDTVEVPAELLK